MSAGYASVCHPLDAKLKLWDWTAAIQVRLPDETVDSSKGFHLKLLLTACPRHCRIPVIMKATTTHAMSTDMSRL